MRKSCVQLVYAMWGNFVQLLYSIHKGIMTLFYTVENMHIFPQKILDTHRIFLRSSTYKSTFITDINSMFYTLYTGLTTTTTIYKYIYY